jgi:hypothetical protein
MSLEEEDALLKEIEVLDEQYQQADDSLVFEDEDEESDCFDPVRDGWVDKSGRP